MLPPQGSDVQLIIRLATMMEENALIFPSYRGPRNCLYATINATQPDEAVYAEAIVAETALNRCLDEACGSYYSVVL